MFLAVAKKSRTSFQFPMFSWWAGVQELGGSRARQLTQAGQWKYSVFRTIQNFQNYILSIDIMLSI